MAEQAISVEISEQVGTIIFSTPKGNAMPGSVLKTLAQEIENLGRNDTVKVILIKSHGEKVFCAGASFDEVSSVNTLAHGQEFFMGFGAVSLAVRNCPKFVVARVQGKVVGGGVGIVASADYALAHKSADFKLSELALGLGPFVIGPAVERKVGRAAFMALSIDADWRNAAWGVQHGLYAHVFETHQELDSAVQEFTRKLARCNPEAMRQLKNIFWEGTDHWAKLLPERAAISAGMVLGDYVKSAIAEFKAKQG